MTNITAFFAAISKELRLLSRDPVGLLILFFMPAALVLIITLVQNNIMAKIGDSSSDIILVDEDHGPLPQAISEKLAQSQALHLIIRQDSETVRQEVQNGTYQVAIFIKAGTSQALHQHAESTVSRVMAGQNTTEEQTAAQGRIELIFNPTAIGAFRSTILTTVDLLALSLEFQETMKVLQEELLSMGDFSPISSDSTLEELSTTRFLKVDEINQTQETIPSAVQQNVPAWTLFGIFFIVVPLSASLIFERTTGTMQRLLVMPSPLAILLLGKVVAYAIVCLGQCLFIWAIGTYILPLFGLPAFMPGNQYGAIALMICAAISAAAGYGILLGAVTRTYDQASMFGAISVVMAAAIGGVMAPVHAMPSAMQSLSKISPLGWALDGLLTIFVRHGTIQDIVPNACLLMAFALVTATIAWLYFSKREMN